MSVDPKWNPTGASLTPGGRYRPVPRRRKIPRWVLIGVPLAVVLVAGVAVAAAWEEGYLGGPVKVTGLTVAYEGQLLNGTAITQTFSTTTGATFIDNVTAINTAPAPHTEVNYTEVCIGNASVSPSTFGIVAVSPPHLCLPGQNESYFFVTVSTPSHPYSGSITITFEATQQNTEY
jgi:hypothetical protein